MPKLFLILILFSAYGLTGCFTVEHLKIAKLKRKKETVDSVLAATTDSNSRLQIYFTRKKDPELYRLTVPLDSILSTYRLAKSLEYHNPDTTSNFLCVDYLDGAVHPKGYVRLLLFKQAEKISREQVPSGAPNAVNLKPNDRRVSIPVKYLDSSSRSTYKAVAQRPLSFLLENPGAPGSSPETEKTYIIALLPKKRQYSPYLLTPLILGVDIITSPVQLLLLAGLALMGRRAN